METAVAAKGEVNLTAKEDITTPSSASGVTVPEVRRWQSFYRARMLPSPSRWRCPSLVECEMRSSPPDGNPRRGCAT